MTINKWLVFISNNLNLICRFRFFTLKLVNQTIDLAVQDSDGKKIHFRVRKMTTPMRKLKKSYAERIGVPLANLRFFIDGRRISDDETADQVHIYST